MKDLSRAQLGLALPASVQFIALARSEGYKVIAVGLIFDCCSCFMCRSLNQV